MVINELSAGTIRVFLSIVGVVKMYQKLKRVKSSS